MKRDASTFFSYRFRMVGQVLAMFSTLLIFHYVGKLVRRKVVGPRGWYFAFVAVGIVTAGVLTSALNTWQIVRMELMAGHFDRVRSPRWARFGESSPSLRFRSARQRRSLGRCWASKCSYSVSRSMSRAWAGDGRGAARSPLPGLHPAAVRGRRTGVQVHKA